MAVGCLHMISKIEWHYLQVFAINGTLGMMHGVTGILVLKIPF